MKQAKTPRDLSGQKFSQLTAINLSDRRGGQGQRCWDCVCDCGNTISVMQQSLTRGNTKTCGDRARHPPNTFTYCEDYVLLHVGTPSKPDAVTRIDVSDLERVLGHRTRWLFHDSSEGKYAGGCYVVASDRKTRLHRFLMSAPSNMAVDHLNGDGLDNRKTNLEVIPHAKNNLNRRKNALNTSGATGVWFRERDQVWVAEICLGGKKLILGNFATVYEGSIAYRAAAKALGFSERHGLDNFLS